jgi:hypothetical protein
VTAAFGSIDSARINRAREGWVSARGTTLEECTMGRLAFAGRTALLIALSCVVVSAVACGDKVKDAGNQLPFGFIDAPKPGDVIKPGPTMVGGWAVDDTGIREIRIYVDDHYATSTTLTVSRPDVAKVHPRYATKGDMLGWNLLLDLGSTPGTRTILVQAVDENGATRDLGVVPVVVPK